MRERLSDKREELLHMQHCFMTHASASKCCGNYSPLYTTKAEYLVAETTGKKRFHNCSQSWPARAVNVSAPLPRGQRQI